MYQLTNQASCVYCDVSHQVLLEVLPCKECDVWYCNPECREKDRLAHAKVCKMKITSEERKFARDRLEKVAEVALRTHNKLESHKKVMAEMERRLKSNGEWTVKERNLVVKLLKELHQNKKNALLEIVKAKAGKQT
jgi:hypothetical protein